MNRFSQDEVERIARLARLKLAPSEKKKFAQQLSLILDYVEKLKQVDTKGIEPINNITGLSDISRQDEVSPSFLRQKILKNAPAQKNGFLKAKGVRKIWG